MISSVAILWGFPRPLTNGPLYEAHRLRVQRCGQTLPIIVDREGVAWANLTILNVCLDLGIDPQVKVVENGFEAAIAELATRDLTLLERTDLVARVFDEVTSAETALHGKVSMAVSDWFRLKLGKVKGYGHRRCEHYLQLGRLEPCQKASVGHCSTPEAALVLLGLMEQRQMIERRAAQPLDEDDSLPVQIERLTTAVFSAESMADETKDLLRMLRAVLDEALFE